MKIKITPAQKKAIALLPLPVEQYQAQVPKKLRDTLESRGLVRVGRGRAVWDIEWGNEPSCGPVCAWPRVRPLHPAYSLMLAESARVGLPRHHKMDLRHDRDTLVRDRPDAFVWVLRECGTHLLLPEPEEPTLWNSIIADWRQDFPNHRYYLFQKGRLVSVDAPFAADWLRDEGRRRRQERGVRLEMSDYDLRRKVGKRQTVDDSRPTIFTDVKVRFNRAAWAKASAALKGRFGEATLALVPLAEPYWRPGCAEVFRHPETLDLVIV